MPPNAPSDSAPSDSAPSDSAPSDSAESAAGSGASSPSADWARMVADLERLVRLRTPPVALSRFASVDDLAAIPRLRRPDGIHTFDQIVAMAARLGWTVGATAADFVQRQCSAVLGLVPRDEEWLSGRELAGVWFATVEDSAAHQRSMDTAPYGQHQAVAVSPLASGRLDPPDVVLIYATPGQMILMINGLQWTGYRKIAMGSVGESACADSWGRALATGEPSVSIPCFAERRYGAVADDELLMATPPSFLPTMIAGLEALSRNGLRYPIPPYGIQSDARAGLARSYGG